MFSAWSQVKVGYEGVDNAKNVMFVQVRTIEDNIHLKKNRPSEKFDKLVENNRRLRNQLISLQANVKDKKNRIKQMKRKGTYSVTVSFTVTVGQFLET